LAGDKQWRHHRPITYVIYHSVCANVINVFPR
jgi:hypothetical protein